jgi:hypothetical protein
MQIIWRSCWLVAAMAAAGCQSNAERLAEARPPLEVKLEKLASLKGKVDALSGAAAQKTAKRLKLKLRGWDANGIMIDYRQLDPKWKRKKLDYRYPFFSYNLSRWRRLISTKPKDPNDRFVEAFRRAARSLKHLEYAIVAREEVYKEPQLIDGRFTQGFYQLTAYLYRLEDGVLLGRYEVASRIQKKSIGTVYSGAKDRKRVLRKTLSFKVKRDLIDALSRNHRVEADMY